MFDDLIEGKSAPKAKRLFDDLLAKPDPTKYQAAARDELSALNKSGIADSGIAHRMLSGMSLGASDEILSAFETPYEMVRHGTFNPAEGMRYSRAFQDERRKQDKAQTGLLGDVAELGGGILTGGAAGKAGITLLKEGQSLPARIGAMAGEGAGYGAVTGFNEGEGIKDRLGKGAVGGLLGGTIGAAIPSVGAVVKTAVSPIVSNVMARIDPEGAAISRVGRAVGESGRSVDDLAAQLRGAEVSGQGEFALADAMGNPGQRLLSTVSRAPGEGRTKSVEFLNNRQAGQADRVGNFLDEALGADNTARQEAAARMAKANAAGPLYKSAFEGGSIAPLEHQFRSAHTEAVSATSQAEKQLASARQAQLLAKAKLSKAGENVYGVNSANSAGSDADAVVMAAEKQLAEAKRGESDILDRLRQAQEDGSANAPGAVWTPRVQQFLNDPIIQEGIRKGLTVQRLEALAKGERFNPTEFAITGADEAGNPIVGKVPNMRLLDAAKRGLDHILEGYRDPMTGRVNLDQYGRAVDHVRRSFLGELDGLNATYKSARAAYADPASQAEAIGLGQRAASRGRAADNIDTFTRLGDSQRQGFREGYADTVNSGIERGSQGVNAARRFSSGKMQDELNAFSSPGKASQLQERLGREHTMFETRRQAIGGSGTAENIADQAENQIDPKIFASLARGDLLGAGKQAFMGAGNVLGGNTPSVRSHLADLLLSRSEAGARGLLNKFEKQRLKELARQQTMNRISRGLLAGEGEYVGQRLR
jgi:hypothetical protein